MSECRGRLSSRKVGQNLLRRRRPVVATRAARWQRRGDGADADPARVRCAQVRGATLEAPSRSFLRTTALVIGEQLDLEVSDGVLVSGVTTSTWRDHLWAARGIAGHPGAISGPAQKTGSNQCARTPACAPSLTWVPGLARTCLPQTSLRGDVGQAKNRWQNAAHTARGSRSGLRSHSISSPCQNASSSTAATPGSAFQARAISSSAVACRDRWVK